jgi:energy-coupling factor transport system ATP-binding protein
MDEAARADRVIVINDGSLVLDGTAKDVFSNVEMLHSMGLEAPQGKELIHLLIKDGFPISADVLSETECITELIKFLKQ